MGGRYESNVEYSYISASSALNNKQAALWAMHMLLQGEGVVGSKSRKNNNNRSLNGTHAKAHARTCKHNSRCSLQAHQLQALHARHATRPGKMANRGGSAGWQGLSADARPARAGLVSQGGQHSNTPPSHITHTYCSPTLHTLHIAAACCIARERDVWHPSIHIHTVKIELQIKACWRGGRDRRTALPPQLGCQTELGQPNLMIKHAPPPAPRRPPPAAGRAA